MISSLLPDPDGPAPALRLRGVHKSHGTVPGCRGVDLVVPSGSVHGVIGENGAGKSTLMGVLAGLWPADSGEIWVHGSPARIRRPGDALALGVAMVPQRPALADWRTALDNAMLGAEPAWRLRRARALARPRLEALMDDTGLDVRLDLSAGALPAAERLRLLILQAVFRGARILILDEPTAMLTSGEVASLFIALRRLRRMGLTLLLVTHRLREVMNLCDGVTVMRQGHAVFSGPVRNTDPDRLTEAMVGRRVAWSPEPRAEAALEGRALLTAGGLHLRSASGRPLLDAVSLTLRAGEIVGVTGVWGHGQTELLQVLAGMRVPAAGTLSLGGERFEAPRWPDAAATRALGLAHVPEDRERVGLVHALPAWESVVLGHQWRARYCGRMGWLDAALIRGDAGDLMAHHDVRPPSPRGPTAALSEGNQQKLMLARELLAQPRVLLAGQPTRGVDIGAAESIHEWLRAVRDSGGTVLLVSADLDEVLALADRVLVMRHGAVVGERVVMGCDRAEVDRLVAGVGPAEPGQARGTAAARGLPGAADPHGAPSLVSTFDASRPGTRPPGGVRMPWTPGADA